MVLCSAQCAPLLFLNEFHLMMVNNTCQPVKAGNLQKLWCHNPHSVTTCIEGGMLTMMQTKHSIKVSVFLKKEGHTLGAIESGPLDETTCSIISTTNCISRFDNYSLQFSGGTNYEFNEAWVAWMAEIEGKCQPHWWPSILCTCLMDGFNNRSLPSHPIMCLNRVC